MWASSHRMETHPPPFRDKKVTNSLPLDAFKNPSLKGFSTDVRSTESKQRFFTRISHSNRTNHLKRNSHLVRQTPNIRGNAGDLSQIKLTTTSLLKRRGISDVFAPSNHPVPERRVAISTGLERIVVKQLSNREVQSFVPRILVPTIKSKSH